MTNSQKTGGRSKTVNENKNSYRRSSPKLLRPSSIKKKARHTDTHVEKNSPESQPTLPSMHLSWSEATGPVSTVSEEKANQGTVKSIKSQLEKLQEDGNENLIRVAPKDGHSEDTVEDKQSGKRELRPVRGNWQISKASSTLEKRSTPEDIKNKSGLNVEQTTNTVSLDTILNSPGSLHHHSLNGEKEDNVPPLDINAKPDKTENKPMSYFPNDPVAINGSNNYQTIKNGLKQTVFVPVALFAFILSGFGSLLTIAGEPGSKWHQTHIALKSTMKKWVSNENRVITAKKVERANPNAAQARNGHQRHTDTYANRTQGQNSRYSSQKRTAGKRVVSGRGDINSLVPLKITLPTDLIKSKTRVKVAGVPSGVSLVGGRYMSSGVWMVEGHKIEQASLKLHRKLEKNIHLIVTAIKQDGRVIGATKFDVAFGNPNPDFQKNRAIARFDVPPHTGTLASRKIAANSNRKAVPTSRYVSTNARQPAPVNLPQKTRTAHKTSTRRHVRKRASESQIIRMKLRRAARYLEESQIHKARALLRSAAKAGSVRASIALARTFDPKYLLKMQVSGIQPDVTRARKWYLDAARKGSKHAKKRLSQIGWKPFEEN